MKNKIFIAVLLVITLSFGQNKDIELDYTVTYEVPNAKKNTIDTVSVSFNKEGTYLYSNARILVDEFSSSILKNRNIDVSQATSSIIYDSKNTEVYINLDVQGNLVFMKLNLNSIIPSESDPLPENVKLITEKSKEDTFLLNKSFPTYLLYAETEPASDIKLVIDEDHTVNNNLILAKFIELMLTKTKSDGSIDFDIPDGVILSVSQSGESIIKAINFESKPIKINISHSFNIEK